MDLKAKCYADSSLQCRSLQCLAWGLLLFLLHAHSIPLSHRQSCRSIVSRPHLCPDYPLQCGFFLHLAVESVCQASGCFLAYLCSCESYLVVSWGGGERGVLLICHPRDLALRWILKTVPYISQKLFTLSPEIMFTYIYRQSFA